MTVRLNEERLEVNENQTFEELVEEVKENCYQNGKVLVQIKLNGQPLSQDELDNLASQPIGDKEVQLISETPQSLTSQLVLQALNYLDELSEWLSEIENLREASEEDARKFTEGLKWLTIAIEQLRSAEWSPLMVGGRSLEKFNQDARMTVAEIDAALDKPQENQELLQSFTSGELQTQVAGYRAVFTELRDKMGGNYLERN
ncbi:MAG: hypothetical protein ACLFO3_06810 [Candidatus Acetothermia bacterium]